MSRDSSPVAFIHHALLAMLVLALPASSLAQHAHSADDVSFDDTLTTQIDGSDVQEALESTDVAVDELHTYHEGVATDAAVVFLRKSCSGLSSCFTTMASLTAWVWGSRNPEPSEMSPLLVDIGPGTFGRFECSPGDGWLTLRGSGPGKTVIESTDNNVFDAGNSAAIFGDGCEELHVQDLTVKGTLIAVAWAGGGSSTWTNVHLIAGPNTVPAIGVAYGWYDIEESCPTVPPPHYFFASRIESRGGQVATVAYQTTCSENWFYGTDLLAEPQSGVPGSLSKVIALSVSGGDARAFGASIRTVVPDGISLTTEPVSGVRVDDGGVFHMHGGVISVDASAVSGANATGLNALDGMAHTLGTAFVVRAGSGGTTARAIGAGMIQSPLLWQAGDAPPVANLVSKKGQDMYVETDCNSSGCTSGSRPHLMIYDASCANSPWFDVVRGECRD